MYLGRMADADADNGGQPAGLTFSELLELPIFAGSEVVAGADGLSRIVVRFNVLDAPSAEAVARPGELLLTSGYPFRSEPSSLIGLIEDLDDAGVSGLALQVGPHLSEVPPGAIAAGDRLGFPLVRLPSDRTFDDILYGAFRALLNYQEWRLSHSEQVHQSLMQIVLRGDGLDQIADELAKLVAAPVAVLRSDGRVLGSAGLEELALRTSPDLRLEVVDERTVRCGDRRLPAQVVVVSAGARLHGYVVAFVTIPDPLNVSALESTALAAALEITKRLELQAIEDKYRSDLMHDLVTHVDDREDTLRRARGFGWQLERRLIAIVVRLDERLKSASNGELSRQPALAGALRQSVIDRDAGAAVAQFGHEVVVLTEAFEGDRGRVQAQRFLQRIIKEVSAVVRCTVSAGQSRPVEGITAIRRAYAQASDALVIGREIHGPGTVQHFADLGAYRILWQVGDQGELSQFAHEMLGPLLTENADSDRLLDTLDMLLTTNGNIAEAARNLNVHYNTVRRRIERLESVLGPVTTDRRVKMNVELALLAHRMLQGQREHRIRGPAE
jgi:purine catabolism regulator